MAKNPQTDSTSAIMASDQCVWKMESSLCNACEGVCWSVEGYAEGELSDSYWRTPIAWASHLSQSAVLLITSRAIGRNADKVRQRELQAILIETQRSLW